MVMHLPMPNYDNVALVAQVVAERQNGGNRAFFNGIAQEWAQRVQQYLDSAGSPATVPEWPAVQTRRPTLLNLYAAPKNWVQAPILKTLRDNDLILCPACGEPGHPNTLDHYLPKGKYPHFCITPANLFPMCDACQQAKDEKTGDAATPRFFIHPYYDVFVANQVLHLEISEPFNEPGFQFAAANGLSAGDAALVMAHVRELEIAQRYGSFFSGFYRRLLRNVAAMRAANLDVQSSLEASRVGAAHPTVNGWEHLFYDAVLNTPALMIYLTTAQLPPYL